MTERRGMRRLSPLVFAAARWWEGRNPGAIVGALGSLAMATHLSGLFGRCQIRTVLDVGANRGQYRDFLRHNVGFRGEVISFEPIGSNLRILQERARRDPRWRVLGCALGSHDGDVPINVMRSDVFSSFLSPSHALVGEFNSQNVIDHVEQVKMRRLDAVLAELSTSHDLGGVYLKMDTQGYDLEVVKGCGSALRNVRALQTEASLRAIYEQMPDLTRTTAYLKSEGFDITGLFPVNRDAALRVIELDCVMVNGRLADHVNTVAR